MNVFRLLMSLLGLALSPFAMADRLYSDSFERPSIEPMFPLVGGEVQLPAGPSTNQLAWIMSELAVGENTTAAEVQAHFDAGFNAAATATFINDLRGFFPNAQIVDAVGVTALDATVVIDSPIDPPGEPSGFLVLDAYFSGAQLIRYFSVSNFSGTVQYPADQALTLTQAADKFETLSNAPALLIGRIRPNMQCEVVLGRQQTSQRATASIFKIWVLGGVAKAIAEGSISTDSTTIPLVASELAPAGLMNYDPLGTVFPLQDVATLMMGNSDNTATDLLHELVGREWIGQVVSEYEHAQPQLLTPFLGISEQFHLFYSFPLNQSLSYVNGSEAFQQQFLTSNIEPLGSIVGDPQPFFHQSLLTDGSWMASPVDVCKAYAHLLRLPQGSDAMAAVGKAMGAQAAQPNVRNLWDRVWYKGGSLSSNATPTGYHVLTHAWLLQNEEEDPWVMIAMSNSDGGGIDVYNVQSITGRMLELVSQLPP